MAVDERQERRRSAARRDEAPARPRPKKRPAPLARLSGDALIAFHEVSKLYDGDVGLKEATFSVMRGEWSFLVGPTGSGKSTIMRLLIKEMELTSGSITVAGKELADIARRRVPYYRRNIGVVFQDFKLLPGRTVYENVAY
ncbi:MAG: ATP-binding cassette domain-containing protein, partial [Solirubrobacteraceae bacterium]